jgi:hypothetical protein
LVWLLGVLCALSIWRIARVTGWKQRGSGLWLLLGANVLLLSPLEYENWLWGFQVGFLLPTTCILACLWIAPGLRFPWYFILTLALCAVCTFSNASGFTAWLITLPLLLLPHGKWETKGRGAWLAAWALGFVLTTVLYFRGYHGPENHPGVGQAFQHPWNTLHYFLAYLGSPFAHGTALPATAVAPVAGLLLLATLGLTTAYCWRHRRDARLLGSSLPWLVLTLVALSNAGLTALGRQQFGVTQALDSRYLAFSLTMPVAELFLTALIFSHWSAREPGSRKLTGWRMGAGCLIALLLFSHTVGSVASINTWRATQLHRLRTKALVLTVDAVRDPQILPRIHAVVEPLPARIQMLNRLGYLRPPLIQTTNVNEFAVVAARGPGAYGNIDQAGRPAEGQYGLLGWAVLPDKHRPADGVLLTYTEAQGQPILFALADMGVARSDVAGALKDPAYSQSGWVKAFDLSRLPPNAGKLRAWAFDAETAKAYPLQGEVQWTP